MTQKLLLITEYSVNETKFDKNFSPNASDLQPQR